MAPAHAQLPGHGDEVREEGTGAPGDDQSAQGPRHRVPDAAAGRERAERAPSSVHKDADDMELCLKRRTRGLEDTAVTCRSLAAATIADSH